MKYLRINNGKVMYTFDNDEWKDIDQMDKEDLYKLVNIAVSSDFEFDEYDKSNIHNQAHQIIYKNIHDKFKELIQNKTRFKDESELLFKEALEKYSSYTKT